MKLKKVKYNKMFYYALITIFYKRRNARINIYK